MLTILTFLSLPTDLPIQIVTVMAEQVPQSALCKVDVKVDYGVTITIHKFPKCYCLYLFALNGNISRTEFQKCGLDVISGHISVIILETGAHAQTHDQSKEHINAMLAWKHFEREQHLCTDGR